MSSGYARPSRMSFEKKKCVFWSITTINYISMKNLWANSSHIKSDHTNKTSARSWEVGLQSSGGNFSIFSLVTLQFICQVCWSKFYRCALRRRPLEEIYFEKRSYPQRCLIRWSVGSLRTKFPGNPLSLLTLWIRSKKAHSRKNEVGFLFCFQSFPNNSHFWVTTCHVNRNTEAPCRVSGNSERKHFAGSYETVSCDRPLFEFCWTVIFISPLFIFNRKHLRQAAANFVVAYRVRAAKIVETTCPYPFRRDSFAFPRRSSLVLVVTARLLFYFHRWNLFFFIFLRSHLLFNAER